MRFSSLLCIHINFVDKCKYYVLIKRKSLTIVNNCENGIDKIKNQLYDY